MSHGDEGAGRGGGGDGGSLFLKFRLVGRACYPLLHRVVQAEPDSLRLFHAKQTLPPFAYISCVYFLSQTTPVTPEVSPLDVGYIVK